MEKRRIDREIDSFRQAILKYVPLDLRAPLSAIIGFSEMILGEIDTAEMTDVPAMAENILVAGYRIHERVEKFLTLNELCTQHLTSEFFSLSPTMHMNDRIVRDIISKHYARNKIHSRIAINIKPATMMIHEYYLTIVLKELLENAAQYSNPDSEILVHGSVHDNTYCLSIRDFGIGMNKEEIARLAECAPCRLPADHQSMTHLGLAIVRKVMELCKGEISFDSKKRSHTTVNVYFPMTAGV
ncbi:MAG TPA: HAMP domain-containing sensor histidine kinase [Bacteroidota bacterium]|nr:HAMP domain-containing sensor histidine kinase [Bacteroidota bacterium]